MKPQRLFGAIVAALLLAGPAHAAEQSSYVMPDAGPMSLTTFVDTYLNPGLRALASCHWGTTAPANGPSSLAEPYQCWADTTSNPVLIKIYDGAQWIVRGALDTTAHTWTPYRQGAPIAAVATSSSASDLTAGTLNPARLPAPTASTLGGTESLTCSSHTWFDTISTAGAPGCSQPSFADLLGSVAASQMPALTGDVTMPAGTTATTLANIPSGVPAAGSVLFANSSAPATPAAGKTQVYVDATDKRFHDKNDAGTIGTTVVGDAGAPHDFLTAIDPATGVVSKARPGCADLSDASVFCNGTSAANLTGTLNAAQFPALTGDISTAAGSLATTLATVNSNVGSFGSATAIPEVTVNAKGLVTAVSTAAVNPFAQISAPTSGAIYKGQGSSAPVASGLTDDGSKVASSEPVDLTSHALVTEIANAGTTGTTLNKLAKLTGAPAAAVLAATTDTGGAIGLVVAGAGTAGNALIATQGQAACAFDGATTAGDYVQISVTIAGDCHDVGASYPASGQIIGRVLSTNAAGGTYAVAINAEIKGGSGGAGGGFTSATITAGSGISTSGTCNSTASINCTVTADTPSQLSTASGSAPSYSARAWVNFSVGGTTLTVNASGNVSSVVRNGVGDYTINFTTAMPDANYAFLGTAQSNGIGNGFGYIVDAYSGGITTGSLRIVIYRPTTSSGDQNDTDPATTSVVIFR